MNNDDQRLRAYREYRQAIELAARDLSARLEVLLDEPTMPEPGIRVEHKSNGRFGITVENNHLPSTGKGHLWVAWEDGQIGAIHLDNLNVYL
jgi:hypothetical protein